MLKGFSFISKIRDDPRLVSNRFSRKTNFKSVKAETDNFGKAISKEEAKRHLKLDNDTKYILFFGFVRDYKGLDLLIEAFADERFRNKNIKTSTQKIIVAPINFCYRFIASQDFILIQAE